MKGWGMKHRYLKNVTTLRYNPTACTGCGRCTEVCPHRVFVLQEGKAHLLHKDSCMECGACAKNCAWKAIEVSAGVGCAAAVIYGWLTGNEPSCDCSSGSGCC